MSRPMKAKTHAVESGTTMNIVHGIDIQTTPERLFEAITIQKVVALCGTPRPPSPKFNPGPSVPVPG